MPQITLFAPDVTCDHCIATIQKTVERVEGARFIEGDPDSRSFAVDLAQGAVLDRLSEALAAEGYPLGPAAPARAAAPVASTGDGADAASEAAASAFAPSYTVEKSPEGASITYTCPCGSTTEHYTYDRSRPEQDLGSCCDHHLLVQPGAGERLRALKPGYEVDVQTLEMPWGQPVEAAFASKG
ncbi:MAG: heavy-metal-associated domain-containing protein [Dehalococcoidia bacterium]|nr:heavy-metal-associated domain-containing protein [Dehalococcoidia bacterium]